MPRPSSVSARNGLPTSRRCDLAAQLPALYEALVHQRDFRREQLAQLDPHRPGTTTSTHTKGVAPHTAPAVRQVQALVEAGARQALHDIELALARIRTGIYGGCRRCGATISLAVLEAIPQTTLCQRCHRRDNGTEDRKSAAAHFVLAEAAATLGDEELGGSEASR